MQVILKEDVPNLGKMGDLVNVTLGFGRNFLIPQGKAVAATARNVKQVEHEKAVIAKRLEKVRQDAQAIAARLSGVSLTLARQAGEEDKLFGSVTSRDIEEALQEKGVNVSRKQIQLDDPIRVLGPAQISIKLATDVVGIVKINVVRKD
jgi:large subunit ribosomal protein L9